MSSDNMALGAVEAIEAADRTGDIIVVGFDAIADARLAIRKGTMEGSLAQYPAEIGRLGNEYAFKLLNGETIPEYVPGKNRNDYKIKPGQNRMKISVA
jgi:ribose transport system substrate-binding protein